MLDKSENSNDSIPTTAEEQNSGNTSASESNNQDSIPTPAEEQNSENTTASESNDQDDSTVGGTNNEHAANETEVPDKYANSTDSIPASAEEQHSYNTTALESNQQDNSSTEEQFVRLTTNMEDGQLQENKVDGNEHSDDAPEGSHSSDNSEVPQLSQKLTNSQEGSEEQSDGRRQTEDPQSEVSSHSRDSKLLEMEDGNAVVREAEKEVNPEGKPETSEDRLSEANQNTAKAVEPVAVPTDANSNMSLNNDKRKETSKRHRRRRFRSRRKKRTTVAATNNDGNHQMEADAAGNTST
ncbi:hypothetical protein PR202_ga18877 [Eleusine coracana subsp. coracana]|uniref:Uncharacterized protein n=1 Tax=Eleusine coracana subsp. coracana TaxID=191504 RepID=A0AAV5CUY3_ELECO|nr:hypothetical protein PR202_ga18877 [Eleusine coracana subsp. coracana]